MVAARLTHGSVVGRLRRVWHIAEHIAAHPGIRRSELAAVFHLSERQVQADIQIIRSDMRLPLVRDHGYRFVDEGPDGAGLMTLADAQALAAMIRRAAVDDSIARGRLDDLAAKLPELFSPHLRPMVRLMLGAAVRKPGRDRHVFEALTAAMVTGARVRLEYAVDGDAAEGRRSLMRPELLLPYADAWYVLGTVPAATDGYPSRDRMVPLDGLQAVTLAGVSP